MGLLITERRVPIIFHCFDFWMINNVLFCFISILFRELKKNNVFTLKIRNDRDTSFPDRLRTTWYCSCTTSMLVNLFHRHSRIPHITMHFFYM